MLNKKSKTIPSTKIHSVKLHSTDSSNLNSSNLSGTPPECFHEYLDLFTEVRKPEDKSLIETPFGGRYCGKIPPRLRISLYNSLSFVFHSDRPNITTERFSGTFQFIPEGKFTYYLRLLRRFKNFLSLCF